MKITSGYSEKALIKKLGIKEGMTIHISNAPDNYFSLLGELPAETQLKTKASSGINFIHLFVKESNELSYVLKEMKENLERNGMMWVSWPKKKSGIDSDLNENIIRDIGLNAGLVDVKVCSIDDCWSGLKFVYRLKDR